MNQLSHVLNICACVFTIVYSYMRTFICNITQWIHIWWLDMIKSYHPTKQPINKRTYAVHTYPQSHHVSHHVLINKSVHARRLCRYSWERTHAITFNTVCSVPGSFLFGIAVNYTTRCQQHIEKCAVTWYRKSNTTVYSLIHCHQFYTQSKRFFKLV